LVSRQGFGEHKTEQLGGHSQEQQRHRQAQIADDDDEPETRVLTLSKPETRVYRKTPGLESLGHPLRPAGALNTGGV